MDDSLGAGIDQGIHCRGLDAAIGIDDVHLRQLVDVVDIELGVHGVALDGGAEPVVLALDHHAQRAPLALEGTGLDVDVLVHIAGSVQLVVHRDEHALAARILGRCHADGVDQVQRAVGGQGRAGAHAADHGDGLVGVHHQAQEIGGLGQGVGAVGDHDAVHIALLGQGRYALGQGQQVVVGEAFGSDLEDLFTAHIGHLGQFGQASQQLVYRHLGGRVGGAVDGGGAGTGNGAAGGQHHDIGLGSGRNGLGRRCRRGGRGRCGSRGCSHGGRGGAGLGGASGQQQ